MSEFVSVQDALQSGSYTDQKAIRDELAEMSQKLRRQMEAGLTPEQMKGARGEKEAADAASELLSKIF